MFPSGNVSLSRVLNDGERVGGQASEIKKEKKARIDLASHFMWLHTMRMT